MSTWIEIVDSDDIEIHGENINILYSSDDNGNNYIFFKKVMIEDILNEANK